MPHFEPTVQAAQLRLDAVRPDDYARTRNALDGAVTRLSPYLTHGLLSLSEVYNTVHARHALHPQHKLVFELGWRAYYRHVWEHLEGGIDQSLHAGLLPDSAYQSEIPLDVLEARTGIPAMDLAVRELYETGYIHNHARMWLASYLVHLRRVHWRAGADWLYAHLLDGDLASNHLSWQWVAGTFSHKPYLFNADNVARYAPAAWHSTGSVIDTSYEALDEIARGGRLPAVRPSGDGVEEPALHHRPPEAMRAVRADIAFVADRDVWLIHPWALREPPPDLPTDALRVSICAADFHDAWAWSDKRWDFVGTRMAALSPHCWHDSAAAICNALRGARSVHSVDDPHLDAAIRPLTANSPPRHLFAEIERPCSSFSKWWKYASDTR